MQKKYFAEFCVLLLSLTTSTVVFAGGDWVTFANETVTRLSATTGLGATDPEEKSYAYGDVDQDGDLDLVVGRKTPFTSDGPRVAVLLMNESGVLVDRTSQFAVASDYAGDLGFQTPTNVRDVVLADFNGDGWLDLVTATTLHDGDPKHLSHPRIYRNRGSSSGVWQGFIFENARFPQIAGLAPSGFPHAPRFCSVHVGDIDEDGDLDMYFGDYDSGGPMTLDFNDRLLVNDGNGYFTDVTSARFTGTIQTGSGAFPFPQSAFGTAVGIYDMNGDGHLDIVKDTALNPPQYVGIAYTNATAPGTYNQYRNVYSAAPYFVQIGDLNNDDKLDMVISDDGQDAYMLNQGNDTSGLATFSTISFSYVGGGFDDGFAGNSYIADLNNDGFKDVVVTDVDIDISGCGRRMHLFRNLGNVPNVTLQEQGGAQLWTPTGVHDTAIFDINADGWLDMVIGRCSGTQVWINQPPQGLVFSYPAGLPGNVPCGESLVFQVQVAGFGGAVPVDGTLQFHLSTNGGPFTLPAVASLGGNLYECSLPAGTLATSYEYYFTCSASGGATFSDPSDAPASNFVSYVSDATTLARDDLEGDVSAWQVQTTAGLTFGAWQAVVPVGTTFGGNPIAPSADATQGSQNVRAFVTQNGAPGGAASASDIDGGDNHLISPVIDLAGTDGAISFAAWFVSNDDTPSQLDVLDVAVSNNGGTNWTPVMSIATTSATWQTFSFQVGAYVAPTANVRVRFTANDSPNNSLTEAGIDDFTVQAFECNSEPTFVRGDANDDGQNNISDPIFLLSYIFASGTAPSCQKSADGNDDGGLNIADVISILNQQFGGAPALPAPFPGCGTDPTADGLPCTTFDSCP
ncbi:MAG: FG-GAP-like repeat-containing protein [Planctomycetota bacterium]